MNGNPTKRRKIEESVESFQIKIHSNILTQPFSVENNRVVAHLYEVSSAPSFGVLLPQIFPVNPIVKFIKTHKIPFPATEVLKNFQNEFWCDLFKSPRNTNGSISEACYFVVLLKLNRSSKSQEIDWENIKRAVGLKPLLPITSYAAYSRKNLIIKTGYKSNATWNYLSEVTQETTSSEFLINFYGSEHPDLKDLIEKYEGYDPIDIILDESFKNSSATGFRSFLRTGIIRQFNEDSSLIFAKQTKSIKHQPESVS